MIAPSSYHRLLWRREDKLHIVETGNRLMIAGLFALAVAIESVVLLVADYLFSRTTAIVTTVCLGFVFVVFWYGLALLARLRDGRG
jgi:predicted lysophospholipase L1 biosynthesis ABC-type transport system permease subunit